MAILLTDSIRAATVKGKIADAAQIFLEGDETNVQEFLLKLQDDISNSKKESGTIVDISTLQEGDVISDTDCIFKYNTYPTYTFPSIFNGVTSTFIYVRIINDTYNIHKVYVITGRTVVKVYVDDIPELIYNVIPNNILQKLIELEQILIWQ